jgi:hypothetical protein
VVKQCIGIWEDGQDRLRWKHCFIEGTAPKVPRNEGNRCIGENPSLYKKDSLNRQEGFCELKVEGL